MNPGLQDGRRRQNHGAMAATQLNINFIFIRTQLKKIIYVFAKTYYLRGWIFVRLVPSLIGAYLTIHPKVYSTSCPSSKQLYSDGQRCDVAQSVEQPLSIPEVHASNPVIGKIQHLFTVNFI